MNAEAAPIRVERGPFEMVPHWLLSSPTMSSHAIRIWLLLRQHGDETKTSFPGRARLAKLIGASRPTVSRAIQELHEFGALCYRQRVGSNGDWGSNEYHIHWDPIESCGYFTGGLGSTQVDHPGTQVDHPGTQVSHELRLNNSYCSNSDSPNSDSPNSVVHLTLVGEPLDHAEGEPSKTKDKDSPRERAKSKDSDGFEAFWSAYPRKVGKGKAREAYAKALALSDALSLIEQAQRYASACQGKDEQFIPHPSTWLNQERWADEIPEPVKLREGWYMRPDGIRVDPVGRLVDPQGMIL